MFEIYCGVDNMTIPLKMRCQHTPSRVQCVKTAKKKKKCHADRQKRIMQHAAPMQSSILSSHSELKQTNNPARQWEPSHAGCMSPSIHPSRSLWYVLTSPGVGCLGSYIHDDDHHHNHNHQ